MFLDAKALKRYFNAAKETEDFALPRELSKDDVGCFTRLLSCTSITEISDISNEVMVSLFEKIMNFSELMNANNIVTDGSLERDLRACRGICPRRIL